ncbi:uncharacterized protein TRAVEDRAFT_138168 [Trametes versicolor FP-101664 SS1]|uniref:uncharacterized protein n=1 Tax=Trametes versicolor (strain FP-101664) TaxID=717944 RepID=UPI0004624691|nr:uncharacterized protein TRAVEDRAFT_138168 [Trametes versicolor FP-101664 SS1]EIW63866.1 hypothetical protein TRAVEDRAFT_138168 [Trametes versicolor FP-101664 SS1]
MSSRRRRSSSRDRSISPSRDRSRSRSPERKAALPDGVSEISEVDYFLKNDEFQVWLKEEKGKYFNELSSERNRKYFRKFVKAWNRGKLSKAIYAGVDKVPSASSQTAYKWSFAEKASRADSEALRAAREEIDRATWNRSQSSRPAAGPSGGRVLGPSMPSSSDRILAQEAQGEYRAAERDLQRKRERKEAKERVEDLVGPKEVGRAGQLEKKKVQREANRAFREKGDEGLEVDDATLMGGGDSFQAQLARREAARQRYAEKNGDRMGAGRERAEELRQKDRATMDMFMQMAKEKFG